MKTILKEVKKLTTVEDKLNYLCSEIDNKGLQRLQRDFALICAEMACCDSTPESIEFNTLCALINVSEMFEIRVCSAYSSANSSAYWSANSSANSSADCSANSSAYWSADWSACWAADCSAYSSAYGSAYSSAYWSANRSAERKSQLDIFMNLLEGDISG